MFGSLKTRASVWVTDFFDKLPALAKESDFVLYHLFIMEGSLVKSPPPPPRFTFDQSLKCYAADGLQ